MIENILGFGADPNPRTADGCNCDCAGKCTTSDPTYSAGYTDGNKDVLKK